MSRGSGRAFRDLLVERDGSRCCWCGRLTREPDGPEDEGADDRRTVDHLVPRAEGGAGRDLANAVITCSRCNLHRGCLPVADWRAVLLRRRLARWLEPVCAASWWTALALTVVWWCPTIALRLGGLVAARVRFGLVMRWSRILQAFGQRAAAVRVCERERDRCAAKLEAALARRAGLQ